MTDAPDDLKAFRDTVSEAVASMFYLSESEAELELLPADPSLSNQESVAATLPADSERQTAAEFMQALRESIDPGDDGLRAYLSQWEQFFAMLEQKTADIRVYRSGSGPVEILIAAIVDDEAVIVRTSAVET